MPLCIWIALYMSCWHDPNCSETRITSIDRQLSEQRKKPPPPPPPQKTTTTTENTNTTTNTNKNKSRSTRGKGKIPEKIQVYTFICGSESSVKKLCRGKLVQEHSAVIHSAEGGRHWTVCGKWQGSWRVSLRPAKLPTHGSQTPDVTVLVCL